ncbi:type II toxin-antitoxin system VapC family toxin [bacterium]|mgnify:FL=1|jgi:predicted nucleic acid-binding protein|nr:type II toxin-antitoxin system VapC family toxin [bacterium]MBT7310175.1 type II toxin-antitoxin system VapC family toxin [bacterium]
MKYLLDTCVVSELVKNIPDQKVKSWFRSVKEEDLFISAVTIGEIVKGTERLPQGKRKEEFIKWMNIGVINRFKNRIIDFDLEVAAVWGRIQANSEDLGRKMPAIDGQIAASAIANNLTVVTRNKSDMEISGVRLFNPWED